MIACMSPVYDVGCVVAGTQSSTVTERQYHMFSLAHPDYALSAKRVQFSQCKPPS